MTPRCRTCGLLMRSISHMSYDPEADWWECECGNAYAREIGEWVK